MSSVKKKPNKNKNKIATDVKPAAPTPAAAAAPPANKNATNKTSQTAVKAKAEPAAAPATSSTRPSLLLAAADDDDAPLARGAPRKSATDAAAAAPLATADQPKEDVLFGNKRPTAEEKSKKRKAAADATAAKKKSKGDDDDDSPIDLFTGTTAAQTLKHLSDPLSHSSLKPGMLVLGAVRAVNEVDLTVQLPHGLTGYVSMREISDTIATIVDQYIEQGERAEAEAAKGSSKQTEEESTAAATISLPILSDFIRVGQLVHCYILSVGDQAKEATTGTVKHSGTSVSNQKSRRIEISLRASLFNQNLTLASLSEGRTLYGSVKSVQEKGYVVDVGIAATTPAPGQPANNITAFLPFSKAPAAQLLPQAKRTGRVSKKADERKLAVGMPILTVITNAKNKRVLEVSADTSLVNKSLTRNTANEVDAEAADDLDGASALKNTIGFTNLQPGMLVKAVIVSVIGAEEQRRTNARMSGLYVRFLDFFHGIIDNLHSSIDASIEGSLESQFHEQQRLTARILYVNYATKKIALTLLPHIIAFEPYTFPTAVKCGDKIMDSVITKVESRQGIYLRLPVPMEGVSQHEAIKEEDEEEKPVASVAAKKAAKKSAGSDDDMSDDESDSDEMEVDEDGDAKVDVTGEQSLSAWAHISRISDSHITQVPKNLTIGTSMPCRILNLHYLDAMVHVSTQPHILEQSILYYEDVEAGMEVQGEIVSVESFGVLLKLTPHITALIPSLHLSDIQLSDPSKKFKVGQTLKARVLYVEERQKKIICTLKKNLLNSSLPKLFNYNNLAIGSLSHGYIASLKDYGLIIEFYNKTHGLVSTNDLIRTGFLKEGQTPQDAFKRGDVHKVRIVHCDARKQRLKLSLGLVAQKNVDADELGADSIDVLAAPGTIVGGTVKEVKQDGLILTLADESDAPKPKKGKAAPAKPVHNIFLPTGHLTDHPSLADALLHTFPVGHKFEKLIVLHKDKSLKIPVVSAKATLIAAQEEKADAAFTVPSSYDTLQPGSLLLGYVRSIADFGVFVGFLDHVSGLAPRSLLADQFIGGDLKDAFQLGQTIRAKVVTIEHKEAEAGMPATTKLTITLKPSQIAEEENQATTLASEGAFVSSFFADSARIASNLPSSSDSTPVDWSAFPLSGTFSGRIKVIRDFGLVLDGSNGSSVQGLVTRPYHTSEPATKKELLATSKKAQANTTTVSEIALESGDKYTIGQEVSGRILDTDRIKQIVDVSLRSELVAPPAEKKVAKKKGAAAGATTITKGSWVPVCVQLVRKQYVVLSLPQHGNAIGYALTTSTNSRFNPHSVFQPGYETKALVHQFATDKNDNRMLLVLDLNSVLQTYAKNKSGSLAPGGGVTFIDPSLNKLSDLQNGKKILVQLRGLSKGAAPSTAGPNSRLEAIVGEVNHKVLTGSIHISQLEDALHERAAAGDKDAKRVLKEHATTPYSPLAAWAARAGEQISARIMNIVRKVSTVPQTAGRPRKAAKGPRTHIATIDLTLKKSIVDAADDEAQRTEAGTDADPLPHLAATDLKVGQVLQVYVKDIETHADPRDGIVWTVVAPGVKGRIHANTLSFPKEVNLSKFKIGQALTAQVFETHPDSRLVDLVLLPFGTAKAKKLDAAEVEQVKAAAHAAHELKVGSILRDLTVKQVLPTSLLVSFGSNAEHQKLGRIHITDLSDKWVKAPLDSFKVGQTLPRAIIVAIAQKEEPVFKGADSMDVDEDEADKEAGKVQTQVDLSLRASLLGGKTDAKVQFPVVDSLESLQGKEGTILQGFVRNTSKVGCFISLGRSVTARCLLKNLSDGYVTDPIRHFPPGKFLSHVKIVTVDPENRTIEVSLRKGDSLRDVPSGESLYKFDEVEEGDNVRGVITQIKPFGLFIRLKDSSLSGLCHISEVSDTFIDDLSKHYDVGDKVRARIVKKDVAGQKISLGLKAKYFTEDPDSEAEDQSIKDEEDEDEQEEQMIEEEDEEEEEPAPVAVKKEKKSKRKANDDEEEEVEMDDSRANKKKAKIEAAAPKAPIAALPSKLVDDGEMDDTPALNLDLNSTFSILMGASAKAEESEEESDLEDDLDDDAAGASKKASRRAKAGARKAEERALLSKEHAILDPNAQPESAEEFERIIVQNPNASMVWIKFMAYQISLTEIDKARKIADRALKSISFRSPQEKLNVWIALLNLENMYGTQKSMQEAVNRAVQFNEPITVYMEVAKIYAQTKKVEPCIETYEAALKKFHGAASIFIAYGQFLYSTPGRTSDARDLLKRALQRLDKSEHIGIICKFASMEFHLVQNMDRGRTLMEGILSNYPKRIDLWNIYLDMEVKLGSKLKELRATSSTAAASSKDPNATNAESIRRLFERITSLNLSTKKMKFFFKKYLTWEKANGADPERLERVKAKAREYVASKTGTDE